jgi:hypothetical protein
VLSASCLLCCLSFLVPCLLSSLFIYLFILGAGVRLSRGLCWFIQGVTVGIPCVILEMLHNKLYIININCMYYCILTNFWDGIFYKFKVFGHN